jgi:type IV secretory pathway TraG/TraD family ATPase VirD4
MGERTIVHPQMSYSAKAWSWWYTNKSLSMHEKGRALMTTAEILQMGTDKEVLFLTNQPPILAEKIQAWKDKTWTKRQLLAPGKVPRNMPGYVESPWMAEGPKPLIEEKV